MLGLSCETGLVYGRTSADEFLRFLGPLRGCVLDIGSGEGGWAHHLRDAGARRLVAVEPDATAAGVARSRYDVVIEQPVEELQADVVGEADLIIVADCLEHLLDPWGVLGQLHDGARPGTRLAVSVPNLRYLGVMAPALMRGRFEYSDAGGIMDRGHLRWFTSNSMGRALHASGWIPTRWSGAIGTGRRALFNRLTAERLRDVLCHQVYALATRGAAG